MNDKITKKIGEADAFAQVLKTMYEAHQSVMSDLLGAHADQLEDTTIAQIAALEDVCAAAGMSDVLMPKVEKTTDKITKMGEMYVGDEWADSAEVLEWLSFFIGGAIIHWQLIAGAGAKMEHAQLHTTAENGTRYYEALLTQLKQKATEIGEKRASVE